MPREIALGDALVPGLLVLFLMSLGFLWLFDMVAGRLGFYQKVWHPPLFRLALFTCIFGGSSLLFLLT